MSLKLINGLNFAEKLNSIEAVTESGKNFLKNYRAFLFSNPCSCGLVNGFIGEAQNYGYDTGVMSILNSTLAFVNENKISWKLASACESINANNSTYNYIAKSKVPQVEKLLEMNEPEVIQYIKGGILKDCQFIPEFRAVCKEVYQSTVSEVYTPSYNVVTPVSFVVVNENEQYFSILGTSYKISEGKVETCVVEDPAFNEVNAILGNFAKVDEALVYAYKPNYASDDYKFALSEGQIEFTKGNTHEIFSESAKFLQYADVFSHQLFGRERSQFMNVANSVAKVYENLDNIAEVDCAKLVSTSNGAVIGLVEAKDNVNLTVFRSINAGTSINSYEYMTEALTQVKRLTNLDLGLLYEARVAEDYKKQEPDSYKSIQEQLEASKDAQMDLRKKKIALLAEQLKHDPVKMALLNNVAKELAILENA